MTIKLLIAPPAGGKTTWCLDHIRALRKQDALAEIQVLVPDRLQASGWKKRLSYPDGMIGTTVSTFQQFAHHLLEIVNDERLCIPPQLETLCIQAALRETESEATLAYFEPIKDTPGLISELQKAFAQMQHALVSPEILSAQSDSPQQRDTARIYEAYRTLLNEKRWISTGGLLQAVSERLSSASIPALQLLIVDGFDEFENDQLQLIRQLSQITTEIMITLPGERGSERFIYRKFKESAEKLVEYLSPEIIEIRPEMHLPSIIKHAAESVFEAKPETYSGNTGALQMIEASSQVDEVREALRWIKSRVTEDGVRCGECALFVPSLDTYQPIIRLIGAEMGIPLYFAKRPPLSDSPVVTALKMLLRLTVNEYKTRELLSVLRAPFFEAGFTQEDLLHLDTISKKMRVINGRDQWAEAFEYMKKNNRETSYVDEDGDQVTNIQGLPSASEVFSVEKKLFGFFSLIAPPEKKQSRKDWTRWLQRLLRSLNFYNRLADSEKEIGTAVNACLEQIVLYEKMLGQPDVNYIEFLNSFLTSLDSQTRDAEGSSNFHTVFVGDITWARGMRYTAAALLGFSERIFPAVVREEWILSDELRGKIGMEKNHDQENLMIQAITRSDRFLLITRPWLTDNGDEWQPSIYWTALRQTLPEEIVTQIRTETIRPLSKAASRRELLFWMALRGENTLPQELSELNERVTMDNLTQARLHKQMGGEYPGEGSSALSQLVSSEGTEKVYSPTRIETWLTCPFSYFVSGILRLEEEKAPELGMDARQLGSLFHKILECAFSESPDSADKQAVLTAAEKACDRLLKKAPLLFNFRPSVLWKYEKRWYRNTIMRSIQKMYDGSEGLFTKESWKVSSTEVPFGFAGREPFEIQLTDISLKLHGIIDRIDQNENGELRVVDYKLSSAHLTNEDFESGRRIQAGVYAAAAVETLKLGEICRAVYWPIKKGEVIYAGTYPPEQAEDDGRMMIMQHLQRFADGIKSAEFSAAPFSGKCPSYCPAAQWCWQFDPEYRP